MLHLPSLALASVTHVVVDRLPRVFTVPAPEGIKWTDVDLLRASIALAAVNALMFAATAHLAWETRRLASQEDQHNRESHSGIVVFDKMDSAVTLSEGKFTVDGDPRPEGTRREFSGKLAQRRIRSRT